MRVAILFFAAALTMLVGCGDDSKAAVYDVPKETPPTPPAATPMAAQTLPEGAVNRGAEPKWTVPASWAATEGSSMRRGSFGIEAPEGAIDIAITSFPGDVGGPLANVNRWRNQLGLPPIAAEALGDAYETVPNSHMPATLAAISNGETSTLAATIVHAGSSWFVKMTGPAAAVARERDGFLDFVRSIDLHQH
jgi:hypothetical protein